MLSFDTSIHSRRKKSRRILTADSKEEEVRRALEKLRRLSGLERSRYSERVERLAERANERQQVFLVRVRDNKNALKYWERLHIRAKACV